jgi:hypothetical protein
MARSSRRPVVIAALALAGILLPGAAQAATYEVGPSRAIKQLTALPALGAGDVVLVDGDATYDGDVVIEADATPAAPVTIRGLRINGRRPVVSGGRNTLEVRGDNIVLDGLDLTAGSFRCLYHHAAGVTVRDTVVHHCPAHGILGADNGSGSLTLQGVEVHHSGNGTFEHQIYMATDETAHPGSVFRMEGCWVHDGTGGNNVKSRAERNEIVGNWIEGAMYHELELIGPDPGGGSGVPGVREDSDVVGNVLRKTGTFAVARVGGDGTGDTNGRYRFAFNTILTQPGGGAVFRIFDGIDSLEMHGNVLHGEGGAPVNAVRDVESAWVAGRTIGGDRNWITTGSTNVPPEWTGTVTGTAPGFVDAAGLDLRPVAGSPLVDAGPSATSSPPGHPFPDPLQRPTWQPARSPQLVGRPADGPLDIGAFELRSPSPSAPGGTGGPPATGGGGPSATTAKPTLRRRGRPRVKRSGRSLVLVTGWTASCPGGGAACTARVRATARSRLAGAATVRIAPGASRALTVRLRSPTARALRRGRVRIRMTARIARGPDVVTARRTVTLRHR